MMRQVVRIAIVLALGASLAGGLYWAFLNTPESNALMLTLSTVLVVACVAALAVCINTAVLLACGAPTSPAAAAAVRGTGWFVLAAVPLVVAWWLLARADAWMEASAGEINAWFIAQFGWADVAPLLQAAHWITGWMRWVLFPVASLSLLAALLTARGRHPRNWLRRAWHWRTLAMATAVFLLLLVLPWQLTVWRPELPPSWMQPAVAAMRLGLVLLLATLGAALMIRFAVQDRLPRAARTSQPSR